MIKSSEPYFTITQFAKLANTNRKKLIYYDNIGLFKPSYIADNGYRYYVHSQIELFFTITTLSNLGMPLKDVKDYLLNKNPEQAMKILKELKETSDNKISKLIACNNLIQQRIDNIEIINNIELYKPYINYVEKRYLFSSDNFFYNTNEIPGNIYVKLWEEANKEGIAYGYPTNYLISEKNIKDNNTSIISNVFILLNTEDKDKANDFLTEGWYAVIYGEGHYGDTEMLYRKICNNVPKKLYEICGPATEEYLVDEVTSIDSRRFFIRLSIFLKKRN